MNTWFRILDYKNKTIVTCENEKEICVVLNAIFPAYTNSFDVVSNHNEFVTCDFKEVQHAGWQYDPVARPSIER